MKKTVIEHLAKLANLTLTGSEKKKLGHQLTEILEYVRQLEKVETKGVVPTSQVTGLENVFRQDETQASLSQDEVLANAKSQAKGLFKVKAIFEEMT
ncbi:MAG: Asp-tRNA(Asn)/Glu-tRNA(Gln) amidotransferase subunit GatC [Candidatus Marinimicrobia bacterium]|nr:Asp-tRNA(Asn)/Glu-tRNA(Gln) amidotransferase subunit GatC [Candidatus Neomarinimicrobiota bacterium]